MRLTKKELIDSMDHSMCFGDRLVGKSMYAKMVQELCEYKDIEEELGIDLITLFKALREKGIWIKNSTNAIFNLKPMYIKVEIDCDEPLLASIVLKELYYEDLDGVMDTTGQEWFMDDYGKTWALTKEELL
jgi:hypothetical protein